MTRHWIRRRARWTDTLKATLVAGGVAATTFYLTRLLMSRELLPEPSRDRRGEPAEGKMSGGEES